MTYPCLLCLVGLFSNFKVHDISSKPETPEDFRAPNEELFERNKQCTDYRKKKAQTHTFIKLKEILCYCTSRHHKKITFYIIGCNTVTLL